MMDPEVANAVEAFRLVIRAENLLTRRQNELGKKIRTLTDSQFQNYARITSEIVDNKTDNEQ